MLTGILILIAVVASAASAQTIVTIAGGGPPNAAPSLCFPIVALTGFGGNLYVASCNQIFQVSAAGQVSVLAGTGTAGFSGDGGPAASAQLNTPMGVFADASGNIFISDSGNNRIREVVAATGTIKTIGGTGAAGFAGDAGPASSAQFNSPFGIYGDASGDLFIVDAGNFRVREIVGATQNVQTIAGNGTRAVGGGCNLCPAINAVFAGPQGVYVDASGNVYITDSISEMIRRVAVGTGIIQTVAGTSATSFSSIGDGAPATSAQLLGPASIFIDASGNIFFADTGNERIREVVAASGMIQTVIGNGQEGDLGDGGPAASASLFTPRSIFKDAAGNIFIAEIGAIREVVASTGNIQTVATAAWAGYSGDGGSARSATLFIPEGVAIDGTGNVFIADKGNHRIREIAAATGNIQTVAGNGNPPAGPPSTNGVGGAASGIQILPSNIAVDGMGDILFSEHPISEIARVGTNPAVTPSSTPYAVGEVAAGTNMAQYIPSGTFANLPFLPRLPMGICADASGNIYIADSAHLWVVEIVASTGSLQVVAGNGSVAITGDGGPAKSAGLGTGESGLFVDNSGNLFIVTSTNVREVFASTGIIQTVAGNGTPGFSGDGGPAKSAQISGATDVAVDALGNIFIADSGNHRIREVVAATGNIQTIAGTGVPGFSGDGGPASAAQVYRPLGLAIDPAGNLIFADSFNSRIREIFLSTGPQAILSTTTLNFPAQLKGTNSSPQTVTVTNSGNSPLSISATPSILGTAAADFAVAAGTTCTAGASIAPASSCTINVTFTPGSAGSRGPATISVPDNASNTFPISLTGTGVDFAIAPQPTGATTATVNAGQTATYNLQLAPSGYTGTVSLFCAGTPGAAACSISPAMVSLNGTSAAPFVLSVTTTARSAIPPSVPGGTNNPPQGWLWMVSMAIAVIAIQSKVRGGKFKPGLVLASTLLFAGILLSSCSTQNSKQNVGTPAGTSTITVTAISGTASRTIPVTMTVN